MAQPSHFLTTPEPGDPTVRVLRRKVRLQALGTLLKARPSSVSSSAAEASEAFTDLLRRNPERALAAAGTPDVLPFLLCATSGARPAEQMFASAWPQLLLEVAEALPAALLWVGPIRTLVHREHRFRFDPPAMGLLVNGNRPEVRLADGRKLELSSLPSEAAWVDLAGPGVHLALADTNPLALDEAHPDKTGNAWSLGERPAEEWVDALNRALELVRLALPTWYDELEVSLDRIVPVGFEPEKHLSASFREAPGLCYLTLHPDPLTLAEAIIHETQHGKLNLLSWIDPVLHNAFTEWTSSPVRPDLRPLWGVLLAVHAFVPVAVLHDRLEALGHPIAGTPQFAVRRAEVRDNNARGLKVLLEKGQPSSLGKRVLAALGKPEAATP